MSVQHYRRKRVQVIAQLGGVCQFCRKQDPHLALAHRYYANDSARGPNAGWKRVQEALVHPERFYLLCDRCHLAFDRVMLVKGIDILKL